MLGRTIGSARGLALVGMRHLQRDLADRADGSDVSQLVGFGLRDHTFPSGARVSALRPLFGVGIAYSVIWPDGAQRPILLAFVSRNHTLPPAPATIGPGPPLAVGIEYSAMVPFAARCPILFPACSVNQTVPSGPIARPCGRLLGLGSGYSVRGCSIEMKCGT